MTANHAGYAEAPEVFCNNQRGWEIIATLHRCESYFYQQVVKF